MVQNAEIHAQLQRILTSPGFTASARSRQFLEFCVDRTMRGESVNLKETTIAVEVFLRSVDYDPKLDPIVRVHARRLREKLDQYYRTQGVDDPIRIDMPKGSYVPQIQRTLPRRKTDFSDWLPQPVGALAVAPAMAQRPQLSERAGWIVTSSVLLFMLVAGAVYWSLHRSKASAASSAGPLMPLGLGPGIASEVAWSPDGKHLAYTWRATPSAGVRPQGEADPRTHIYIERYPADGQPTVLLPKDTLNEGHPVWSPNGREIAFARRADAAHMEVVRYSLADGRVQTVGRFLNYIALFPDSPALGWSPDGRSLVTSEQTGPSTPVRLVLLSLGTGERTVLTTPPTSSTGDLEAAFSPDGQWIAFHRGGLGDLYLVSVRGEQVQPATRLTFDNRGVHGIAWTHNGQSIFFGTRNPGSSTFGIYQISRSGGIAEPVTPANFDAVAPAFGSNGVLAFQHRDIGTSLVEYALPGGGPHRLPEENGTYSSPMLSPNGNLLAYTSTRSGCMELWLSQDGHPAAQVTHFQCKGSVFLPAWSPNNHELTFSFRDQGTTNLFVYDTTSRSLRQITSTKNRDISSVYSSDSRYLYYSSNDDGTSRIWRVRTDGASRPEPMFIEAVGGFAPSPDGHWLYYLRAGSQLTLLRRNLEDSTTEEFLHLDGRPTFINGFVFANNRIYLPVSQDDNSASDVYEVDPATHNAHVVLRLHGLAPYSESGTPGFSVAGDGSKLAVSQVVHDESYVYTTRVNP